MYYIKRKDPYAKYVAKQIGIDKELEYIGDKIHKDDMPDVMIILDINTITMNELFRSENE